jgi:hypothetical protein
LRKLVIKFNNIVMRYDTFQPIPQLEFLDLSHNKIKALRPGVFSGLTQLKFLDLSHNRIAELKADAFPPLTDIEEVHCNNNVIHFIDKDIVTAIDTATIVDFSKNFAFDMKFTFDDEKNKTFSGLYMKEIMKMNKRWANSTTELVVDWIDLGGLELD